MAEEIKKQLAGYLTLTLDIKFWIFSLNLTMAEEIKKQLATMWEKEGG